MIIHRTIPAVFSGSDLIVGDCAVLLKSLPCDMVNLTVTSPPYDGLRTYDPLVKSRDRGDVPRNKKDVFEFDFETIAQELYRVTKPGGVVVWVVGDATVDGSETCSSFRQALFFHDVCGFNLHDTMIFRAEKPPLNHNRYEQKFEYMFVFSKGRPSVWNAITELCNPANRRTRNRTRRQGGSQELKTLHAPSVNRATKTKGNIWYYAIGGGSEDKEAHQHPAIFPEALAAEHIQSWSNIGDLVFDPFSGSGTTAKMAAAGQRRFLGIEISETYAELSRQRVTSEESQPRMF